MGVTDFLFYAGMIINRLPSLIMFLFLCYYHDLICVMGAIFPRNGKPYTKYCSDGFLHPLQLSVSKV